MSAQVGVSQELSSVSDAYDSSDVDIKDELMSDIGSSQNDVDCAIDSDIEVKDEVDGVMPGNAGMASVMSRILGKTAHADKPVIMSKSLTERQLSTRLSKRQRENKQRDDSLVIVKSEEVKSEPEEDEEESKKKVKRLKKTNASSAIKLKKKVLSDEICHRQPDPLDKDKEMNLIKIATRGVVQLFNAVKSQQKQIKFKMDDIGSSITKSDKVLSKFTSGDFLDNLKSQKVKTITTLQTNSGFKKEEAPEVKDEPTDDDDNKSYPLKDFNSCVRLRELISFSPSVLITWRPNVPMTTDQPGWDVLRSDYLLGAQSMKDWDKQESEDEAAE